jgi:hypothetical protein
MVDRRCWIGERTGPQRSCDLDQGGRLMALEAWREGDRLVRSRPLARWLGELEKLYVGKELERIIMSIL